MSTAGIAAKRESMKQYFIHHPDSQTIHIVGSTATFPAVFSYAAVSNNKDKGNVMQQKRVPHLTFFSGNAGLLVARVTQVIIGSEQFMINTVKSDKTEETFQAEAWLI